MGVHKSKAAPLVKGSWRGAPEGLTRRGGQMASPMRGSCRRKATDEVGQLHAACNTPLFHPPQV